MYLIGIYLESKCVNTGSSNSCGICSLVIYDLTMPRVQIWGFQCERCDHKWVPRDDSHPKVCPKCKSPYWDTPRQTPVKAKGKRRKGGQHGKETA